MKFLAILSTVIFAAFAVAGPLQAYSQGGNQVEKRQDGCGTSGVSALPLCWSDDLRTYKLTEMGYDRVNNMAVVVLLLTKMVL